MKKWILPLILFVFLAVGAVFLLMPANNVYYDGESVYTKEELNTLVFGTDSPKFYLVRVKELLTKHREIPFIAKYDIDFEAGRTLRVHLYEKSLAGYIRFQNYYLYFDWDGILVEIGTQHVNGLYEVKGLEASHAVKGESLPVSDSYVLRTILTLTQFLNRETIRQGQETVPLGNLCSGIRFRGDGVELEMGEIHVFLGESENMQGKLYAMEDILPELNGKKGTLYLDAYRAGDPYPRYTFKEN